MSSLITSLSVLIWNVFSLPHLLLDTDFFFDRWIIFKDPLRCFLVLAKLCDRLCAVIPFCKERLLFFRLVTGIYLPIQDFSILDEQLYFAFSGLNEVLYGGYIRQLLLTDQPHLLRIPFQFSAGFPHFRRQWSALFLNTPSR